MRVGHLDRSHCLPEMLRTVVKPQSKRTAAIFRIRDPNCFHAPQLPEWLFPCTFPRSCGCCRTGSRWFGSCCRVLHSTRTLKTAVIPLPKCTTENIAIPNPECIHARCRYQLPRIAVLLHAVAILSMLQGRKKARRSILIGPEAGLDDPWVSKCSISPLESAVLVARCPRGIF